MQQNKQMKLFAKMNLSKWIKISLVGFFSLVGILIIKATISTFAFFWGIVCIGIVLSVQNILTDLFSGILLLMDRSIKPGNLISINDGQLYGVVNKLHARYISLKTREGGEQLIPNKYIIANKLENWSYMENRIKVEILFKVSVQADPLLVENILKEVALATDRVIDHPSPTVYFHALTDSCVELFLHVWISDLQHGTSDIRSEIILKVWKAFRENKIQLLPSSQGTYENLVDIQENRAINFS